MNLLETIHLCGRLYGAQPELSRRGTRFGSWRFPDLDRGARQLGLEMYVWNI